MEIILIRHFATKENIEKRYLVFTDTPSIRGDYKIPKMDYEKNCLIFTSPLLRCRETADIIFPKSPKIVIESLKEMNFGKFENKSYDELKNDRNYMLWLDSNCEDSCPDGESKLEFIERTKAAICQIIEYAIKQNEKQVAIIAHDGTAKAAAQAFFTQKPQYFSFKLSYGESVEFICNEKNWKEHKILTLKDCKPA
ncbi:MAG: histidine phosphatase family protein [Oscillospiraceae bacterium]